MERSHWSDSTADVRAWLDGLPLAGGGCCGDTAFAEALADAIALLRQAETRFVMPPDGSSTGSGSGGGGGAAVSSGVDGGGGAGAAADNGSVSQQVVVVARSDPHRLAIPWPVAADISPKVSSALLRMVVWSSTVSNNFFFASPGPAHSQGALKDWLSAAPQTLAHTLSFSPRYVSQRCCCSS